MKKVISLVLALAVVAGFAVISEAKTVTTTTTVFEEYFDDWTNATPTTVAEQGWAGGHNSAYNAKIVIDAEEDASIALRNGSNITKTFDTLYDGIVTVSYNTTNPIYVNKNGTGVPMGSWVQLYLELEDGSDASILVWDSKESGAFEVQGIENVKYLNREILSENNETKIVVNTYEQKISLTINGATYSGNVDSAKIKDKIKGVKGLYVLSQGDGINYLYDESTESWVATDEYTFLQLDDVVVTEGVVEEIPDPVIPYLVFKEDFNDWENSSKGTAASKGYTEGNNEPYCKMIVDSETDKSFGVNQFGSLVKTFETPYEGDFGVTYKSALSDEYINMNGDTKRAGNVMELNLTLEDNTSSILSIYTTIVDPAGYYTSVRGNVIAATQDMRDATIFDGENDVKVLFDYNAQKFYVTINGITKEINTTKAVKALSGFALKPVFIGNSINGVEYENTAAEGEEAIWTATGNIYYGSFDDIKVYNKPAAVTPAMTYLNMDFAYDEDDFFQKDLYSTMNYGTFTSSSFPAASATDEIATELIKFENNELVVSNDVVNESNRPYYAVINNLPDKINDELVELSFKAKRPEGQPDAAVFGIYDTNGVNNIVLYIDGNDESLAVNLNHQDGDSAATVYGISAVKQARKLFDAGYHNYKLLINNKDKMYSLYIDGEYAGTYSFVLNNTYSSFIHKRIALKGIIVDDIVIKQAPLMTQTYYKGVRGDGTAENLPEDWADNYIEAENAYGHYPKFPLIEYWYAENFTNVVNISNPTGEDKTAMVINALYDNNGKLISVAASEEKTLNKLAEDGTGTTITSFEVTHSTRVPSADKIKNGKCKTIVLESINTLTPVYEAIVLD